MRSCIYCGRELEPGEKCTCAKGAQRGGGAFGNGNTENNGQNAYSGYNDPNRTEYRTGYTHKDNLFTRMREKSRARANARRNAYRGSANANNVKYIWQMILKALKAPVDMVRNPVRIGLVPMLILWAVQGALAWLCLFFVMTHAARGPFAILGNLLAFHGIAGYKLIGYMLMALVSGSVAGAIGFFVYTGVFYLINRFIFRNRYTKYEDFCNRLAFTAVPLAAVALLGSVLSVISITTLAILLVCGAAIFVILTYEALRAQWQETDPNKAIYAVMLGFFVIVTAAGYIIRLS